MKKILTLLFAVGAVAVAQAQYSPSYPDGRYNDRDVILGQRNDRAYDNNSRNNYSFSERERDEQIARINREYDKRIRQVDKDRRLRYNDKQYQIRHLEDQRKDEIRQVWERFRSSNNRYSDRYNSRYPQNNRKW